MQIYKQFPNHQNFIKNFYFRGFFGILEYKILFTMGLGNNRAPAGDNGTSFNFRLRQLQLLQQIVDNGGGGGGSGSEAAYTIRATGAGTVPANTVSVSVYNAGNADATFNGATVKSGEQFTYSAQGTAKFTSTFAYDGTGTELVIVYVI